MPKLIAKTTIEHDGKPVATGEAFTVASEEGAQALIAGGWAEAAPARKPAKAEHAPATETQAEATTVVQAEAQAQAQTTPAE